MREYTIRLYIDNQTIVEYNIAARGMNIAEDEALRKYADSGLCGRIMYLTTTMKP